MRFSELPYDRPDLDQLKAEGQAFVTEARDSDDASLPALVRRWDDWRKRSESMQALAAVHFSQDTKNPAYKAEKEFFDAIGPDLKGLDVDLLRVLLERRQALASAFGEQLPALWSCTVASFDPSIAEHVRAESDANNRYDELTATTTVEFEGEQRTMSALRGFYGDADRGRRLAARRAQDRLLSGIQGQLDGLFDELVDIRHRMAQQLGEPNYIDLGYRRLGRTDYGAAEVAAFRQAVEERLVPLCTAIRARHAKALGVDDYAFHDTPVRDLQGVPRPKGDEAWMREQARALFSRMGRDFFEFYALMEEGQLLDLDLREGKVGGGYCESLQLWGLPFIFANFNGTQDDVNVFTHECGHAFQCWTTMQTGALRDLVWPTYEACEIHSMGLEMLTYPDMELFFGEDAGRFVQGHIESSLLFLPYGVAVDAFQHEIYANPSWSAGRRAQTWAGLEKRLLPEWIYRDMPHFESGRFWQRQGHIYGNPFYYIDYCLAQTCAFQLWQMGRRDRGETMRRYRRLCELGGRLSFRALLRDVGLADPFEPDTLARVADDLAEQLQL